MADFPPLPDERESANNLANVLLDEPWADPDDDLRVLSRQLLLRHEEIERLTKERHLKFPAHMGEMTLVHNAHRNVYEPIEQWIRENTWCDWENEEAKARAIASDDCWTLQWYPHTPVGFNAVAAPTLEEVLRLAGDGEAE
jgi:hypothetical protein